MTEGIFCFILLFSAFSISECQYHSGDVRLIGGSYPWEGRVEIYLSGVWGTVTDSQWTNEDAQVVCRGLGYFKPGAIALSGAYFGEGSGTIYWNYVRCYGTEYNLTECETANDTGLISHSQEVGVMCQPAPGSFHNGDIRLVGSSKNWKGRVELYLWGTWRSVGDNSWTDKDAQVVCRQLGHSEQGATGAAVDSCCVPDDSGNGSVRISSFSCQGTESSITSCRVSQNEGNYFYEVAVTCQQGSPDKEGDVRLVGGAYPWQGWVEIFLHGSWGRVGDYSADSREARVVCRQLGYDVQYDFADMSYCCDHFGLGRGPIHMSRLQCTGGEHRLLDCPNDHIANIYYDDWGISCRNDMPEDGEVRLYFNYYSSDYYRGRLEVFLSNVWGTIAGPWTQQNGAVVCHQMGFEATSRFTSYSGYSLNYRETAPTHLSNVNCQGSEVMLTYCTHTLGGSGTAVFMRCDYYKWCFAGQIRLVGGQNEMEGRLEVCSRSSRWGTVCDKQWSPLHTSVVCRQLGYSESDGLSFTSAIFGQGSIPIVMDYVNCSGSEVDLWDCLHFTHSYGCTHSNDVGVRCQPAQCEHGDIRLVDGTSQLNGKLALCLNQRWEIIIYTYRSKPADENSQVVCYQLGFSSSGASRSAIARYAEGTFFSSWRCDGSEQRLVDCNFLSGASQYPYRHGVRIQCQPAPCEDGEVRLVGGETEWEGRLEVCLSQRWGSVSSRAGDGWPADNVQVVCRDLGYETSNTSTSIQKDTSDIPPATASRPIFWESVVCSGTELTLLDCTYNRTGDENDHSRDVIAHCQQPSCEDGDVRLVDGESEYEGLVEVCLSQRWGTVNGDGWSSVDTQVVCRQLGYPTEDMSFSLSGHRNKVSTPIFMDIVSCSGSESKLISCTHHRDTSEDEHSEDIRVHCAESTSSSQSSNGGGALLLSFVLLTIVLILCVIILAVVIYIICMKLKKRKPPTAQVAVSQKLASNGAEIGVSSFGESKKENAIELRPSLLYATINPLTTEPDTLYQPLNFSGQQQANLQDSCKSLKKTTTGRVKKTSAGCEESGYMNMLKRPKKN